MKKNVVYINFYKSHYQNEQDLELQQQNIFSYKEKLRSKYELTYILRSNLKEFKNRCFLKSKQSNRFLFLTYCISYLKKNRSDFVIIHGLDYFIEAAIIKILCRTKIILQHHAEKTYLRKKALLMPFADKFIDAYFFNGQEVAKPFVQKRCIESLNKAHSVIEASSDFKLLLNQSKTNRKEIVFIGRLNENKNLIALLKAIASLKNQRQDFHLSIYYTSKELELTLKAYCDKNNLHAFVDFKGYVSSREIENILNQSDIFVSCSFYEGSGYALIESLSCGCFPVVSHIPAFNFLLEGLENKKQFDLKDEMNLVEKLNEALDLEINVQIRKNIRAHFDEVCSSEAIANQIDQALLSLR